MTRPNKSTLLFYSDVLDILLSGESVKGWHRFKSKTRELNAYYNKKLGVVIKRPVLILEERTPKKFRVPTYELKDDYILQPLISKKDLGGALVKLRKEMKPYIKKGIFPDLHRGNVGWYNGEPLMFDW
jgi:hypothetical protein